MNKWPPLWLPEGSVRALIAMGVVGVTLWMWATGHAVSEPQVALTAAAAGGYFATRYAEGRTDETKATVQRIEAKVGESLDAFDLLRQQREKEDEV